LHRKIVLASFLLGVIVAPVAWQIDPVSAHFTLGELTDAYRFHADDFDPHVPGPTAFLWPGAGYAAMIGSTSGLPPGYQSPWPGGNPPSALSSWYQLEGNSYAPFGAILTSTPDHPSIGDMILGINFTRPTEIIPAGTDVFYSGLYIYIPPEFAGITQSQIVTTITNDYSQISVSVASDVDPFAPGWTRVSISSSSTGFIMAFRENHDLDQDGVGYDDWYYIRMNGVIAPEIAGKYFFKIILRVTGTLSYSYPSSAAPPTPENLYMPVQNWPVVLVKGEVDPAVVYGTIRYGTWNQSLYGQPIPVSGRVRAVGQAMNPYTGQLTRRPVEARGFFNETARGHYEVEGLAPGLYDLYASGAGFPEQKIATGLVVRRGQSMKLDGYLNPGPVVSGRIFSKSSSGPYPWPGLKPIRVEIYATNEYTEGNLVTFSPLNLTGARWGVYASGNVSGVSYSWSPSAPPNPTRVAFSWTTGAGYYSDATMFAGSGPTCGGSPDPCGVPNGVSPGQFWWVDPSGVYTNGGGPNSFIFRFGWKGVYGTPTNMSGYVPQALASWVDGLHAGRYFVRVFVNGYVQTTPNGESFNEYYFEVSEHEWAGNIFIPIDIYVTSTVNVTVHLHSKKGSLAPDPISRPNSLLVELYDMDYNLVAMNFTQIVPGSSSAWVLLSGLGLHGSNPNRRFSLYAYRGFGFQDYGIPPTIYQMKVYVEGFLQEDVEHVTIGAGPGIVNISTNIYRGATFEVTLYSLDWQHPRIQRDWRWPGERIKIQIYNSTGVLIDTQPFLVFLQQPAGASTVGPLQFDGNHAIITMPGAEFLALLGTKPTAYATGIYTFKVSTYGYIQPVLADVVGFEGNATSDVRIDLVIGANITVNLKFKTEGIFSPVPFNMSMRLRVFDEGGDLVAAWMTGSADDVLNGLQLEVGLSQDPANPSFLKGIDPVHRDPSLVWWIPSGTKDLQITLAGIPSSYLDIVLENATTGGLKASPIYQGLWTIEADTVNWYHGETFYPPVPAMLQGESHHFIETEPYPYGWTGELLRPNHLGPYSQRKTWLVPNTYLGAEVSVSYSLDLNGYLQGQILGMTWTDEARSASWIGVYVAGARMLSATAYTLDGYYDMYLPPGEYEVKVTEWTSRSEGHRASDSIHVVVTEGQNVRSFDFVLDQSQIPIPEGIGLGLFGILPALTAVSSMWYRIRRRRLNSRR